MFITDRKYISIKAFLCENVVSFRKSLANVLLYLFIILLYLLYYEETYNDYALINIMYIARYLRVDFAWLWLSKIIMKLIKNI